MCITKHFYDDCLARKDGRLSQAELGKALRNLSGENKLNFAEKLSEYDIKCIIEVFDGDGDGFIDFAEFQRITLSEAQFYEGVKQLACHELQYQLAKNAKDLGLKALALSLSGGWRDFIKAAAGEMRSQRTHQLATRTDSAIHSDHPPANTPRWNECNQRSQMALRDCGHLHRCGPRTPPRLFAHE
jgi:hypothetical protein